MPIPFVDFSKIPTQDSAVGHIFENILKGYAMSKEPQKMQEEQSARELANKLKSMEVEHKPKEYELDDRGKSLANSMKQKAYEHYDERFSLYKRAKEAQIEKANRPDEIRSAFANALKLRNLYPEGTQERQDVEDYIKKLKTSRDGINVSSTPEGGVEVSIGGNQTGNIAGIPNLKKGEVILNDDQGKPVAIGKPLAEKEKKEESGRLAFNVYQPFITNAQAPYSGRGSNKRFERDVLNYSNDPKAKERVDNMLAAEKLLFSTAVKEAATLGSANTNMVYKGLLKSLKSSEIFPLLKDMAAFQLPEGYTRASSEIFNKVLNEGTELGKNLPAYRYSYLDNKKNMNKSSEDKSMTKEDAKKFYLSLSPSQRDEYKKLHMGAK